MIGTPAVRGSRVRDPYMNPSGPIIPTPVVCGSRVRDPYMAPSGPVVPTPAVRGSRMVPFGPSIRTRAIIPQTGEISRLREHQLLSLLLQLRETPHPVFKYAIVGIRELQCFGEAEHERLFFHIEGSVGVTEAQQVEKRHGP